MPIFEAVLERATRRYRDATPTLDALRATLVACGALPPTGVFDNDHVAFRTFGVPGLGIAAIERLVRTSGYERRDDFRFEAKRLDATWFAPPLASLPRIFVSELRVDELSPTARRLVASYADAVARERARLCDPQDADSIDAFLQRTPWPTPTYAAYRTLLDESEYAAWVLAFGHMLNHQTFSVHTMRNGYHDIETLVGELGRAGHALAESGGAIKTSADGLLRQASTRADDIAYAFACGRTGRIAGSYVEFAERGIFAAFADLPLDAIERHHRRDGFETQNADRIFESTDR